MKIKQLTATGFVILACLASLVIGFGVEVAQAVTLGQVSRSDVGAAKGSWQIDTTNGTQFRITGLSRDYNPGGNSVYWSAVTQKSSGICYVPSNQYVSGSCSQDWYDYKTVTGTRFNSGEWRSSTKYSPLSTNSKGHRVNMRVCEDKPYWPDPCSSQWSISPLSYWMK